jgi:N-acylneuraminate cytidylyltransferase|tara:strand:- start:3080 stop:3802 length:723 start_codon:yes stop_codon:yes gene_type:complete
MKRLAVIPARGGSKRIHKKNIKTFCGKPIISYSLEAAESSNLFDTIHVSTDCNEIAEVVTKLGYSIDFLRDPNLADDMTPIMPVLKWVISEYESRNIYFDEVVLLMPCSPMIESFDLQQASMLMDKTNRMKPVIAISSYPAPTEWAFTRNNINGSLIPADPGNFKIRSQDLEKKYFDSGSFIFFPKSHIKSSRLDGNDESFIGYILDKVKAIDIDDQDDWDHAELIMELIQNKKSSNHGN